MPETEAPMYVKEFSAITLKYSAVPPNFLRIAFNALLRIVAVMEPTLNPPLIIFIDSKKSAERIYARETVACYAGMGVIYLDVQLAGMVKTEAEIAGLIAHEIGHMVLRHRDEPGACGYHLLKPFYYPAHNYYFAGLTWGPYIFQPKRMDTMQQEADMLAVQYAMAAKYNPVEFYVLMARITPYEVVRLAHLKSELYSLLKHLAIKLKKI